MTTSNERKAAISSSNNTGLPGNTSSPTSSHPSNISTGHSSEQVLNTKFREALKALDAERTELVKNAIDCIKPGRTFDAGVVRKVNKIETLRNRLIVAHFAWLLKHNPTSVHAIVHQIIEL